MSEQVSDTFRIEDLTSICQQDDLRLTLWYQIVQNRWLSTSIAKRKQLDSGITQFGQDFGGIVGGLVGTDEDFADLLCSIRCQQALNFAW